MFKIWYVFIYTKFGAYNYKLSKIFVGKVFTAKLLRLRVCSSDPRLGSCVLGAKCAYKIGGVRSGRPIVVDISNTETQHISNNFNQLNLKIYAFPEMPKAVWPPFVSEIVVVSIT